ncbi:metallophosphoesterase [Pseudalkalibacillus sp. R45]|uniref:metallophosphoesterase n=1 Tax=Pseudalkalibacillus sp. R45 TaxID=3457433 RepID=UPI003FCD695B
MKALIMSDLHLDINEQLLGRSVTLEFINWLNKKSCDVVFIAGDLAGDALDGIQLVERIQSETNKEVYFVAGNHDVWVPKDHKENSWSSYDLMYKHPCYLNKPIQIGRHTVIGDMGWYDYSFGLQHVPHIKFKEEKKHVWKDGLYARWETDDEEILNKMIKNWRLQLEEHKDNPVMFINHFIPYKEFLTWYADDEKMNFCQAYMGSNQVGELVDRYQNVDYVVFGHTHKRHGVVEHHGKKVICQPFGYVYDWLGNNFVEELDKASVVIDL